MDRFFKLAGSGLGLGYSPYAPGTCGTLLGIPFILLFAALPLTTYLVTLITLIILACWIADHAQTLFNEPDSGKIVIDEVIGMICAMVGHDTSWLTVVTAFVIFRAMDIWKPFPARWLDRHMHNGAGVVLDDVVAGVYANILLWILIYFFPQ